MSRTRPTLMVVVVVGMVVGLVAFLGVRGFDPDTNPPGAAPSSPSPPDSTSSPLPTTGPGTTIERPVGYVVTEEPTPFSATRAGDPVAEAAPGLLFPVLEETAGDFRVFTMCNTEAWLPAEGLRTGPVAAPTGGFADAVFVIDPGHGIPDYGAVGPEGLTETEVNMDVSTRIVELLSGPRDVEWDTGAVTAGSAVPAAADALMTRHPDGPDGGEYRLGLSYRIAVANAVDATAFVSIHHNSSPEADLDRPGSEAFVSLSDPESSRLGGLIVDELRRSLARFEADWKGSTGSGLVSRVDEDGVDYYTVLKEADVPAAIVEGAYISNPSEEALARTDEFRQAYAESVYRALVRFVTTDDAPIPPPPPTVWNVDTGTVSMDDCLIPRS